MIDLSNYNILEIYLLFFYNIFTNKNNIDLIIGVIYITIHFIYVLLLTLVVLISSNILHLFMMIIIITINVLLVLFCRTCPLMLLELKYLNIYALKSFLKLFKNTRIKQLNKKKPNSKSNSKYLSKYIPFRLDELTLESLLFVSLIYIIKIMCLMIHHTYY
jgi:hypothetical protein